MADLVSVILPTFQRAHLVSESIESVLSQTYPNWELIVIDDGSTDNSFEIIKSYIKKDKRIKYLKQQNKGVAAARNAGLKKTTGGYIAFIDSDDVWLNNKLEKQVTLMEKKLDCMLLAGDVGYPQGGTFFLRHPLPPKTNFESLFLRNYVATSTVMLRKKILDLLGCFKEEFKVCEDYDLWLRIALNSHIEVIPDVLAQYRNQPDSLTTDRLVYLKSLLKLKSIYPKQIKSLAWKDRYSGYYRYKLAFYKLSLQNLLSLSS
jgi:glycosyltransferase involved in cell wall biosynthesis